MRRIILGLFLCMLTSPALSMGVIPKSAACKSLEALWQAAQQKLAAGWKPTAVQRQDGERRYAWYQANCR